MNDDEINIQEMADDELYELMKKTSMMVMRKRLPKVSK